jgi:hypothetical protein
VVTAPEWTRPRLISLAKHAAASDTTPDEALDALLALPPLDIGSRRRWTEAELALLRNPRNRPTDIARQTNRTTAAVSARRTQLARDENLPALQNRRRR